MEIKDNMQIYNQVKEVPNNAQKKITGGRLSGMTDIKPQWRIEKLTEVFGPVGIGWYTEILKEEIIDGANGEKISQVDINLFVNYKKPLSLDNDLWSKGIFGTGGSSFIAKEKSGLYTSDECFKMAYTDALSVSCKMLGIGADVYWGDSKYDTKEKIETKEQAEKVVITFGTKHKNKTLKEVFEKDQSCIDWLLKNTKDENIKQAIYILRGKDDPTEDEEKANLMLEINKLEIETNTAHEDILANYKVQSNTDMTIEQLKDCIGILKKKLAKQNNEATPYDF